MGAGDERPENTDEVFAAYLRAKTAAEEDLKTRTSLDWTILRPGLLTDDDPTGEVLLAEPPVDRGSVPRADVAAVIEALIDAPSSVGKILVLTSGPHTLRAPSAGLCERQCSDREVTTRVTRKNDNKH